MWNHYDFGRIREFGHSKLHRHAREHRASHLRQHERNADDGTIEGPTPNPKCNGERWPSLLVVDDGAPRRLDARRSVSVSDAPTSRRDLARPSKHPDMLTRLRPVNR
jgi:hypothetical protein